MDKSDNNLPILKSRDLHPLSCPALNCWIASLLYFATLCVSAQQFWANHRADDQFKVRGINPTNRRLGFDAWLDMIGRRVDNNYTKADLVG